VYQYKKGNRILDGNGLIRRMTGADVKKYPFFLNDPPAHWSRFLAGNGRIQVFTLSGK
jgi:hypothetical protein